MSRVNEVAGLEKTGQVVALLGGSVLMDSIEASLSSEPGLNIVRLSGDPSAPVLWPAEPDLILTDLNELRQRTILIYLKRFPDTPMLGIDATPHGPIAMSMEPYSVRSIEDLTAVIRNKMMPHSRPRTLERSVLSLGVADRT